MKRVLPAACFGLAFFCAGCRTASAPADNNAAAGFSEVDRLLRDDFIYYLGSQEGNQPAAEIRAWLLGHPELGFRVTPAPAAKDGRYWASFDSGSSLIRVPGSLAAAAGYSEKPPGAPAEERGKSLASVAPRLVYAVVQARVFFDLGFKDNALESELLGNAYEAWYIKSDPALAKPENFKLGAELYDQLAPLASAYGGALEKAASPEERRKLVDAVNADLKTVQRETPDGAAFVMIRSYSLWAAFTRGWPAFTAYVRLFHPPMDPVLAGPGRLEAYVKYLEYLRAEAVKEGGPDPGPVFDELMAFWGNPDRIARAQAYFRGRLDAVSVRAGPGSAKP